MEFQPYKLVLFGAKGAELNRIRVGNKLRTLDSIAMGFTINVTKLVLVSLSGLGFYLTWYIFSYNGSMDMMKHIRDVGPHVLPYTDGAPLKKHFIGIAAVDYQLTVLTLFFYNIVDGSHPSATLLCYYFGGQLASAWGLVLLESERYCNKWSVISL